MILENIRIVMVRTSHPGNIGSAARAMKTMGLTNLVLVSPERFPNPHASALASGADDVLTHAVVVETLLQAIQDCQLVIGTSARLRNLPSTLLLPDSAAKKIVDQAKHTKVAIVFGHEQAGLSNEELCLCHFHLQIPANPEYSVLNLAAAIQIITYEIRKAWLQTPNVSSEPKDEYATVEDVERFFQHLAETLIEMDFYPADNPRRVMPRLRRLFQRTRLESMEVRILRGILSQIQWLKRQRLQAKEHAE